MKVYKGVTKDLRGYGDFQYEVGKTYETENPDLCSNAFHGCEAPLDVLRHYPLKNGNRYFEAELEGVTDQRQDDTKRVGSKVTLGAEIGLAGLIKAQINYTREKAESGTAGGNKSNLAGGNWSNLACGDWSNLAGGDGSNLAGGYKSTLAGGDGSVIVAGNGSRAKAGMGSVIVLVKRKYVNAEWKITDWKAGVVDGVNLKPDVWYKLENGEFVEAEE